MQHTHGGGWPNHRIQKSGTTEPVIIPVCTWDWPSGSDSFADATKFTARTNVQFVEVESLRIEITANYSKTIS